MKSASLRNASFTLATAALVSATGLFMGCKKEVKELKIGFITEQTGAESYIATSSTPALEDYIAKVNEAGGVNGYKLKLVVYDTRSETPDAVTVSKRLIDQDKVVAIIGPSWSAAGIPLAQIADTSKIPFVATTASNVNVTVDESGKLHPYMFRVCFIDPYQGYALADFTAKKLNIKKVAFLTDISSPYTVGVHKFFEDHFKELGGEIIVNEGYNQGDTEFRAQLSKIKAAKPELLMSAAYTYKDAGLIAQQMDALGLKVPYMGADGVFVPDLLEMAGPKLEGAYVSTGLSEAAPEFQTFNAAFEAKHKSKATIYTYYGLDALMMIEHGIKTATANGGKPEPSAIRDAIENMQDVQLFTSKVTMEKDTHNPHNKPLLIMTIKNSKFVLLETFDPGAK
jgi:branched-chain amino acid transport system substrate-binding protein